MTISYQREDDLSVTDFIAILTSSTLAQRRPVDDPERISMMLEGSNLIVTARDTSGKIIGVARSITDWSYCLYCSDLAVDTAFQGRGIGKTLLAKTIALAPQVKNHILISAPDAVTFYEQAGYVRMPNAFLFNHHNPS